MSNTLIYPAGVTKACTCAAEMLRRRGLSMTDHPTPEITHLLLDIPAFHSDGRLKDGSDPERLLSMLPQNITVAGGNLQHPALKTYRTLDFLQDDAYLAENAFITADCALKIAAPLIRATFADTPTLILGWGRIGKCLARLLKGLHCPVTVAARKKSDRALLHALGYEAVEIGELPVSLSQFQLLFNTIPAPILDTSDLPSSGSCVKIELASVNGIQSEDTIIARGLPGRYAPESSGRLIADTFYRLWKEESQ